MWGLDYIPGDEPEFECVVCGRPLHDDTKHCGRICREADEM